MGKPRVQTDSQANQQDASSGSSNRDSGEFSIDLLAILQRRLGLIVASGVMGLIAAVAYLLIMPPSYQSESQILLMQDEAVAMANQSGGIDSGPSEDLLATHMSLIQSKKLVHNALANSSLLDLPSLAEKQSDRTSVEEYVIDNLYVTRGGEGAARDARILTVAFRHTNPKDSQSVNQALVSEYQSYVKDNFNKASDGDETTVELIETARKELEAEIATLSSEYREFRKNSPLLASTEGGANVYALRYEELAAELSQLDLQIDEAKARLGLVKSGLKRLENTDGPGLQKLALIDERNAERLGIMITVERGEAQTAAFQALQPERMAGAQVEYSSLLALKGQLRQAMESYGPKHPEVKALVTQVDEMEEFIAGREEVLSVNQDEVPLTPDDIMAAYVSLLENDLVALQQRRQDITRQSDQAEVAAKELLDFEFQDEQFRLEIARQEDLYSSVVERIRDINLQAGVSPLIQEVIEDPSLGKQVSPNKPIAAAIAVLTTMFLAVGTILVAELSDKRIHSSDDMEAVYGCKILSTVPDFARDAETRLAMKKIAKSKPSVDSSLITFHDANSRISEVFRGLRTQMLFSVSDEKCVYMVTSPTQGEGKSTTVANLAISFAGVGKSVALVDCDLRRPRISKLFSALESAGVADVLNGTLGLQEALQDSPVENLSLLTAGSEVANPAELLAQAKFETLVEDLRKQYDIVIIDCPPLLPVADPAIVCRHVDGVIIVTTLDAEGLPKANRARRILDSTGVDVLGVVINKAGAGTLGYGDQEYSYTGDYVASRD